MEYTKEELTEAKRQIDSTLHKLRETIKTLGSKEEPERYKSQITLAKRRVKALEIANDLIENEKRQIMPCLQGYTEVKEMKFAFLILGGFAYPADRAAIHGGQAQIVGVEDIGQACAAAQKLEAEGVGCIELCGAFGEAGAKAVIEATGNRLPVGYVTHLPRQDEIYRAAFSD